ncbi:uncharacterized protein BDR25DRAFT_131332 [Lindgomyces ingoldianus]|uniref:Uncharacterized protein n=1 Tax=Lindgomyces ingoldianus TaxID=673940 RepID=A0ACB6R4J2_9PLEO|nr:uncharacterized protein BDR25DRAFT_131332 [Lindgomyces ingoldianus]KAF2473361.1 hypothetical protein BDR25DRAFT_131332 [Lindgomyces ingoldianus]
MPPHAAMADRESPPATPRRRNSHSRPATAWVGGQRRRLVRRSGLPRSRTTPAFTGLSAGPASPAVVSALIDSLDNLASASTPAHAASPTPTLSTLSLAESPASSQKKKKTTWFGGKERAAGSSDPLPPSPLPETSVYNISKKAGLILGLDVDVDDCGEDQGTQGHGTGSGIGTEHGNPEYHTMMKDLNAEDIAHELEKKTDDATRQTRFKEEGLSPNDQPAQTVAASATPRGLKLLNLKAGNSKAAKLLGLVSSLSRSKSTEQLTGSPHPPSPSRQDVDMDHNSDAGHATTPPRPIPGARNSGRRKGKKKGPKELHMMPPIKEASDDGIVSQEEEGPIAQPLMAANPLLAPDIDEDDEEEPSSEDQSDDVFEDVDDGQAEEVFPLSLEGKSPFNRRLTKYQKSGRRAPEMVQVKSPLQDLERMLLDNTERKMRMDTNAARLHGEHAKLKNDLKAIKRRSTTSTTADDVYNVGMYQYANDRGVPDDDVDSYDISIANSIDVDEKPTIQIARIATFTRIVPGMVKLVSIPAMKTNCSMLQATQSILPKRERMKFEMVNDNIGVFLSDHISHNRNVSTSQPDLIEKKDKFPKEGYRKPTEDWVNEYRTIDLRPLSMRIDPAVLADQNLDRPPTPPPKDISKNPLGIQNNQKHYCIVSGHVFMQIKLWHARGGVAAIKCEQCKVKEVALVCEVRVCGLGLCYNCAIAMQAEWEGRAVASWEE